MIRIALATILLLVTGSLASGQERHRPSPSWPSYGRGSTSWPGLSGPGWAPGTPRLAPPPTPGYTGPYRPSWAPTPGYTGRSVAPAWPPSTGRQGYGRPSLTPGARRPW